MGLSLADRHLPTYFWKLPLLLFLLRAASQCLPTSRPGKGGKEERLGQAGRAGVGRLLLASQNTPAAALRTGWCTHCTLCLFTPRSQAVLTDWESKLLRARELGSVFVGIRRSLSGQ